MTAKPPTRKGSTPERRALNQHLHRHHGGITLAGSTEDRFAHHDDLHWQGGASHRHAPYQDGESRRVMAERFLREGEQGLEST